MFKTHEIDIRTQKSFEIIDITDKVNEFLKENNFKNGLMNVFVRHTTAVLRINEKEDGFFDDLKRRCDKNISIDEVYKHNDLENRDPKTMCESKEECLNGHSHVRAMLVGNSSETVPVKDGKLQLGVWQRILLLELDHARPRKIMFSFVGE